MLEQLKMRHLKKIHGNDAGPIDIDRTNFFRCLIFDLFSFTNADVVTIKNEHPK